MLDKKLFGVMLVTPETQGKQEDNIRPGKEISESEARYRTLFEKAPISITLLNPAGVIIDCNQACEELLGYTKEEIIGKPFQKLMAVAQRDLPKVIGILEKFLRGEEVAPYELEVTRKTGEKRWVNIINSLMMKGENIVGIQVLATDITERKQAEIISIESERRFREKSFELQIINEIISYGNTASNLTVFLQKTLVKILQFSHFLGGGIYLYNKETQHNILATYESLPEDFIKTVQDIDMTQEHYKVMLTAREPVIVNDYPNTKQWKIKSVIAIAILAEHQYIGNLNLASEVNLPLNLPELKLLTMIGEEIGSIIQKFQTERLLSASEVKYRSLFEDAPYAIVLLDSEGKIIECNSMIEKLFGYKKDQIIGYNFLNLNLFSPLTSSSLKERFVRMTVDASIKPIEAAITKSNGETAWVYPTISLIRLEDKKIYQYILQDITERKETEQRLQESEEKYRTLFEQSPDLIVLDDSKGRVIDLNSTVEKVFGFTKKDMVGKNFLDLGIFSPEVISMVKQNFQKRLKGEPIEYYELPTIASNGDIVWIFPLGTSIVLRNEAHVLYILQNITERKLAQQKLKESEERYRTLFEESPSVIVLLDSNGTIIDINSTVETIFGWGKEEIIGKNFQELGVYSPEALHMVKENFPKRIKGEPVKYLEIPIIKSNGDNAWVTSQATPLKLGNETLFIFIIQDITARKIAQQQLKESEEKYRLITENSNDFIMVNNSTPMIEYVNEASYHRFLGYTNKDLRGTNPLDLIHPEDQELLIKAYPAALDVKGSTSEIRVKRKDGTYLWVEMRAKSFVDGSGKTKYLSISRDISERKAIEEERKNSMALLKHEIEQKTQALRSETEELQKALESLKIAQEHLVQSEKLASIGLLAAGVAHEINNPLMGIINYAQIIKDELETKLKIDLNIKPYSFLNGIIKEGERISEIVEGLLSFAREDRGKFIPAEISEIINSALALLLPKIKNSQIEVNLEFDRNLPKIPMKTRNIRQVILNVLQNSIAALNEKYGTLSKKGEKVITIKTSRLILDEKPYTKISIKDNGTGIRSENLPKIFDPFFTTKGITGTKGEGTGLGLSISYGIIRDHKGRIDIQSEWGKWTLLNILLPLEL